MRAAAPNLPQLVGIVLRARRIRRRAGTSHHAVDTFHCNDRTAALTDDVNANVSGAEPAPFRGAFVLRDPAAARVQRRGPAERAGQRRHQATAVRSYLRALASHLSLRPVAHPDLPLPNYCLQMCGTERCDGGLRTH